jgi:ankyrin repeat protein
VAAGSELFEAIELGDVERVRALVAEEPSVAASRDPQGVSALMRARYRSDRGMTEAIIPALPELDVFEAASFGDLDRLVALLEADPSLATARAADGFTALHFAAYFGGAEASRILLDRGADPDAVAENPMRVAPLHSAVSARREEVVGVLLERGADPDARQQQGWTPLHSAAHNGHLAVVDRLLAAGADPSPRNDDGRTPLDMAEQEGHADVAVRLWERGGGRRPGAASRTPGPPR